MNKSIEFLQNQLLGIHSKTISAGLIDTVRVNNVTLNHLATTVQRSNNKIDVLLFDLDSSHSILKALKDAGFNAYQFSKSIISVSSPEISGDSKKLVASKIKKLGEEAKIAIRNTRKKFRQKDDEKFEKLLQKKTEEMIAAIDQIVAKKISSL